MLYVPAGIFTMGSSRQRPIHDVYLDAYWIDKYEVTNAQYARCVADGTCTNPVYSTFLYSRDTYYGYSEYDDHPVIYVTWSQAEDYCRWPGGRLPTEAEWEKAARGIDSRAFSWGNDEPNCNLANYKDGWSPRGTCLGFANRVGSYPAGASPYGAMDMAGNVWEWVADWYDESYYEYSPLENPTGPESGTFRILRGGSWYFDETLLGSAHRFGFYPTFYADYAGFRCVVPESQP